ncbi:autotransporter translocation and assembly factor TamB [Pontibacter ummariensis]|uniref:Autotransporter translocation and assembly factor TamB n=1 Tax=Pontibacter ummariensis TaxID=1610492 RepID=A0A239FBQ5_9BACT|nr:translocation/assembly module TamB domain-containing protein [Pontibacter ummariensis]PRY12328.1 autotransporter translocation and assembly factor TamB [Pontibacter ummariensis]SNS54329.1 Autotransporter translocation and assembly factor TamB [Pontibacter ummariensis]
MGLFLFLLLLFAVVFVAIRFPAVQTKVAQKAASYLSEATAHEVSVGRVDLDFFSNLILEKVRVQDYRGRELFYVGRALVDIETFSLLDPNTLTIGTLELEDPKANLVMYEGSDTLNLRTFFSALGDLFAKDTTRQKASEPFNFQLNELILKNGQFTYDDFNKPRDPYGIDYAHLTIEKLSGRFNQIQLDDTLKVNVQDLTAIETRSSTVLHNLDTRMTYAPTYWEWGALDLQIGESNLQHYVRFDYNRFGNFSQFIDSVTMTANLQRSHVYAKDIATFASSLREYDEDLLVNNLELKGKVSNFTAREVDLAYGEDTHIVGNISADGLPNFKETFATFRLQPSTLSAKDIKQFLPQDAYEVAARLGTVQLEGSFLGFYNDFVANGDFATALGNLKSDINLKIDDDTRSSSYSGFVTTRGFNLGKLLAVEDKLKTISMSGRLEGSGFSLADARVKVDATVNQIQLLDYDYQNIKANGTLRDQTFTGTVAINDPNLVFAAEGAVELGKGREAFNMVANLERANLQALKLTTGPLVLSAEANLNFKGLNLDAFEGVARLDSAFIKYNGNQLLLDSVLVQSEIGAGERQLRINSDLLALQVNGNFDYSTLIDDLEDLVQEYKLNFESDEEAIEAYYSRKPNNTANEYAVQYELQLKQANPLLELFLPELSISDLAEVEGSFRHGTASIFELYADIDTILYDNLKLYDNSVEINTSKLQQSPDVLAAALFTSQRQTLPNAGNTQDFYVEGIWSDRTINFATSVRQPEENNRAMITGDLNFLQNEVQIVFDESNITLQESPWAFVPGNTLYISERGQRLEFENFALTNQNQVIRVEGTVSEDPDSKIVLNVENFQLNNLNPVLAMPIEGELTAKVMAQDIYDRSLVSAAMEVDSFYLDKVFIGDVVGSTDWSRAKKVAEVDLGIVRDGKKVLAVTGNYNPEAPEEQLDLLAVLDQANLKLAEPLLSSIMSNLEGAMEGRIRVLGSLDYPILKGSVMVNNGKFTFDYLNTTYRFTDRVYFGPNSISFRNAQLLDQFGNKATVTGGIAHDGFQNMVIDLEARYRNFMVLNTTEAQNELFYGTAFATGTASVLGPVNNLQINVDARSEKNTRLVLPLDYDTDVVRKDFIRFVSHKTDSTGVNANIQNQSVDLSGITMNFELDITDDAYFEIIIDRVTGDVIRGSGNGDIRMTIDTRGDFNMYGSFEITEGAYNFNLLEGLVSKEFRIVPGGTISWNGDPVDGVMNITAQYTQMASLADFVPNRFDETLQGRRYPIIAVIGLTGPLLSPEIQLGLSLEQVPQQVRALAEGAINSAQSDESELNRQVFSLLVLQRLSAPGTFALDGGIGSGAVGGSLGSLLSGQLNNFFNSLDSNLEIDVGLGGLSQEDLATLQLRLSYTFFQGRLRVTNETGFGGMNNATGSNAYIGDWSVEYYITQNGELRARLSYSSTPNIYTGRITNSQSVSLLHTKRFDNFRELFGSKRREQQRQEREMERERIILDSDPRLEL